ncbi:hypothetical protein [Burkholderia ubonensis]|uniref:hypothetical protein n=1 Tax=Burkholderia ubonensis TaxID=101571 RepID=UPI000AB5845C|nr:hypothetical protein [Burkholderia ubonensis]
MSKFNIDFVGDMDYEHLMAEISFEGQRLCVIDKEGGSDGMQIEFLVDLYILPGSVKMKFSLDDFMGVVNSARDELRKCA